jgi:hypothetical protein
MNVPDYKAIFDEYAREPEQIAVGDGAALLDCVSAYIRRYVSVSEAQLAVLALWAVHTHLICELDYTPYLAITSAEKESGKSVLLGVLKTLVKAPWLTAQVSPAALFRTVEKKRPTLLLDESDPTFNGNKEYAEALRGLLNTGYERKGTTPRCVGKDHDVKDFSTFCAKAIAGIGRLPDTVAGRSIPIRLKRALRGTYQKFRERNVELEAFDIRTGIERFADAIKTTVAFARPALPDELSGRQQDTAECLIAIADLAGGKWPDLARTSLIALCVEAQGDDDSTGVKLLSDIRYVFEIKGVERISSTDLATALAEIETSPWGEYSHGKPMNPAKVAHLLKPFGVRPVGLRIKDKAPKGYHLENFNEPWSLYLTPHVALPPIQSATLQHLPVTESNERTYECCTSKNLEGFVALQKPNKSNEITDVADVALSKPPEGYTPDRDGPGCTCQECGHHFGTVAGWRYHITGKRCQSPQKEVCSERV